ncbi:MAG: hypothetical protein ACRCUS_04165, partial [Anaerovoracaceae bacterium]
THPHTSAGRIPSAKAYRLYVDELMSRQELPEKAKKQIADKLYANITELDKTVAHAAKLLSEITNLTSFAIEPKSHEQALNYVNLLPVDDKTAVTLYLDGLANIFSIPEYSDIGKAKMFIEMVDRKEEFAKCLAARDEGMMITIGEENLDDRMKDCSVITATYHINGEMIGSLGVIGPTRMQYDEITSIIEYMTENINSCYRLTTVDEEE